MTATGPHWPMTGFISLVYREPFGTLLLREWAAGGEILEREDDREQRWVRSKPAGLGLADDGVFQAIEAFIEALDLGFKQVV